jgi:hypothetical protein
MMQTKLKLHYNAVKGWIDEYFTEVFITLKEDEKPQKNTHYPIKTIDTKDQKELAEFADRKLKEYLNPSPIFEKGKKAPSRYLAEISKNNAINKQLRTPEMFFKLKFSEAKEYSTYFPDYLTNAEHLKYHSKLEDWIKCLRSQLAAIGSQDLKLEKLDSNKNSSVKTAKPKPQTLLGAWKDVPHYFKVIEHLKQEYAPIQNSFITQDKNKILSWVGPNYQYLGAFLKKCKGEGYVIQKGITAKDWVTILNKTFPNLTMSGNTDKPFRPGATFDSKYLDAFENLPRP